MTKSLERQTGSALTWRAVQDVGVKAIYLVRIPILARLLLPEDFGLMAIALVALDVLMRLTDVGMVPALVQRDKVDARHYDVAWTVGVGRALIVTTVVMLGAPLIASIFAEPRAVPIIRLLALRPLLTALASIKVAELTRELRFRGLAFLYLWEALLNTGVSIAMAPYFGVWALVLGALAGATAFGVSSYVLAPYRPRFRFDSSSAVSLIRFGRWIFLIGIIALTSRFVLQAVISRQLGTVELGLYYLAARIAYLPNDVAFQLIGSVAFPLYARLQNDVANVRRVFRSHLTGMVALLVPVTVLIIALAPSLVRDLLGARWQGTAPVIRVLSAATLIGLYGQALVPLFKGWGQPWRMALLDAVQATILISLVWGMTARFGLPGAVGAWIPAIAITQLVGFVLLRRMIPDVHRGLWGPVVGLALMSVAGGLLAFWIDSQIPGLLGLVTAAVIGWLFIAFMMLRADRRFGMALLDGLFRIQPGWGPFLTRLRRVAGGQAADAEGV